MSISDDGALALSFALAVPEREKPAFDRSQVFMICMQNFVDFRRLSVTMLGGRRFEIDSRDVPFSLDEAADWLVCDQ